MSWKKYKSKSSKWWWIEGCIDKMKFSSWWTFTCCVTVKTLNLIVACERTPLILIFRMCWKGGNECRLNKCKYLRWHHRPSLACHIALQWCVYVRQLCVLVPFSTPQRLFYATTTRLRWWNVRLRSSFSHYHQLTLSFFFLSGVMKPFLAFLALEASSIRLRTSARLRSISACLAFFACLDDESYLLDSDHVYTLQLSIYLIISHN